MRPLLLKPLMLECHRLSKQYGNVLAVRDMSLTLEGPDFLSVLGPSGCGKSTLLRLVAGLEHPDSGAVRQAGTTLSGNGKFVPPEQRHFGMVFQDFVLFPHMTVAENIAYGIRGLKSDRQKRVLELLDLVSLSHLSDQMPHQISGGEQQRVALARSLAPRPQLILMDEPFSNLDHQLRVQLRQEIHGILKHEGVPTILVTHDQSEAITFSDQMVLMNRGTLVQSGTPKEVYQQPSSLWAATFVGEANQLPVRWAQGKLHGSLGVVTVPPEVGEPTATLLVRPENLRLQAANSGGVRGVVRQVEFRGASQSVEVQLESGEVVCATTPPQTACAPDDAVSVHLDHFLCYGAAGQLLSSPKNLRG